ncbi:hypothetical protein SAMN02745824_2425 [Parasphingorhabdus marina DSM 22363]|uniref:Uncharacterized protein n=1 Tax=Parasphingorhabdus marina DSM 22363 TaxID=1123272 RepID=A0A1N6FJX1_9SPHN|nr:hypothetical protein [Parasphingorhabdus marina]SIN95544.1 hypothetical protein SAMN02745824_2425 [Parasphingorhabdus marina DSM 22363]
MSIMGLLTLNVHFVLVICIVPPMEASAGARILDKYGDDRAKNMVVGGPVIVGMSTNAGSTTGD